MNGKYPEAVIVDQLPKNLIQHVRSSNNAELQAALDPSGRSRKTVSELRKPSSQVLHHSARPRHRVKQSPPASSMISDEYDSNDEANTSDEETEIEETEIEFIPRSK